MSKRVTIMINDDLDKKLRTIQAKLLIKRNTTVSYSAVINEKLGEIL